MRECQYVKRRNARVLTHAKYDTLENNWASSRKKGQYLLAERALKEMRKNISDEEIIIFQISEYRKLQSLLHWMKMDGKKELR